MTDLYLSVEPHKFKRRGWRFWICDTCFAPRSLHPRLTSVRPRERSCNHYISKNAPHFKEGW